MSVHTCSRATQSIPHACCAADYKPCPAQLIIERAYAGEKDHVKHALDLFVDFAAIFVRILVRHLSLLEVHKTLLAAKRAR